MNKIIVNISKVLIISGIILTLAITISFPENNKLFLPWVLTNNFFFTLSGLFGILFLSIHLTARAHWAQSIHFPLLTLNRYVPAGVLVFALLLLAMKLIFPWMEADLIPGKSWYLNQPFFIIRTMVILLVFMYFTVSIKVFIRNYRWQKLLYFEKKLRILSSLFIAAFAVLSSPFIWDWILSLEFNWYSTLFAWYVIAGMLVSGTSFTLLIFILFRKENKFRNEKTSLKYLSTYLFAFSCIWAYMWYVQYMLIWYGNLPEEVVYYISRTSDYPVLFYFNIIAGFAVPFVLLVGLKAKQNIKLIALASVSCLAAQWSDKFLLVVPAKTSSLNWQETATGAGITMFFGGLFLLMLFCTRHKSTLMQMIKKV